MRKVRKLVGSLLLLGCFPLLAKPVMEVTIPTTLIHLNSIACGTYTFSVKNSSGATLPNITIPKTRFKTSVYSAKLKSTTCTGSLANNASCEVVLSISATEEGNASLEPIACAFNGAVCSHGSLIVKVDNVIQGTPIASLAANLPSNVRVGTAYPIVATFFNTDTQYPITGVTISKTTPDCVKTADTCDGIVLAPQASCQVSYIFTPPLAGSYHLAGTFSYNEGPDILNQKTVLATDTIVVGSVVTPLPANIEKDREYPVVFRYTNFGTAPATGVNVTYTGFTPVSNTCASLPSQTLAAGATCDITTTYKAGFTGPVNLTTNLTATGQWSINPVPLSSTSTSTDVAIMGTVSPALPTTVTPGVPYPVVFTFTNPNPTLPAKDVAIDKLLPNFTQSSDTCGTTLAPGASCNVGGIFQTANEGPVSLSVIFDHDDNVSVPLPTTSIATQASLVGTVVGFPANVETNVPQPVTFTFANHGSADATINSTTLAFPNSTGPITNNCTNSLVLSPGQDCTISGTFQNAATGPATWGATVNYSGGFANANIDVNKTTSTTVSDTVVTGSVQTALPGTVQTGTNHNFTLRFTNSAGLPATNVHVVTAMPNVTGLTNNCPTTLASSASCTVSGTFNSPYAGPYTLSATLLYDQGSSVPVTTTTNVQATISQVTVRCDAGYACEFSVTYRLYPGGPFTTWSSGSFPIAQERSSPEFAGGFSATNSVGFTAHGGIPSNPFIQFSPNVLGHWKGKMWGTVFGPSGCLTLNGAGCY